MWSFVVQLARFNFILVFDSNVSRFLPLKIHESQIKPIVMVTMWSRDMLACYTRKVGKYSKLKGLSLTKCQSKLDSLWFLTSQFFELHFPTICKPIRPVYWCIRSWKLFRCHFVSFWATIFLYKYCLALFRMTSKNSLSKIHPGSKRTGHFECLTGIRPRKLIILISFWDRTNIVRSKYDTYRWEKAFCINSVALFVFWGFFSSNDHKIVKCFIIFVLQHHGKGVVSGHITLHSSSDIFSFRIYWYYFRCGWQRM